MSAAVADSKPLTESFTEVANLNLSLGWRSLVWIFVLFLVITSDMVTTGLLSKMEGAMYGQRVTTKGAVVQGIMLVIAFALAIYLQDNGVF
jgi:hypothetical protein